MPSVGNITGFQLDQLKPAEGTQIGKPLPASNSVVEINVLGKSDSGNYRLLIAGNFFQSSLPINVLPGEILLARVIGTNPFTLSLGNLMTAKGITQGTIAMLLSKLNLGKSENAGKLLKILLSSKKPVVKSKLEKLINMLENENIKLNDQQLNFLMQVLGSTDTSYKYLNKSYAGLFQHEIEDVHNEIFECVKNLSNSNIPDGLRSLINKSLILNLTDEDGVVNAIGIKGKSNLSADLTSLLNEMANDSKVSEVVKSKTEILKDALIRNNLIRANYQKIGLYSEFIILYTDNKFELFKYQIHKKNDGQFSTSFGFELNMKPEQLGQITIDGYLSGNNLNVDFEASDEVLGFLESGKDSLVESLTKGVKINPNINFCLKTKGDNSAGSRDGLGINVTV